VSGSPPDLTEAPAFRNYRNLGIATFILSDVLLIVAVASWVWFDKLVAIVIFILGVFLSISAFRGLQVYAMRREIEHQLDRNQTILAELGGRRHRRFSWFHAPIYLLLTEDYLYAFDVGFKAAPPIVRRAYGDLQSVRFGTKLRAATLLVELPDQTLEIVGIMEDELRRFEIVLKAKRPSAPQPGLADYLHDLNAD
jgi:hypothetical protein